MADLEINDQYDFFKNVRLDDNGALVVSLEGGTSFSYVVENFTALSLVTGMITGELAYLESSEGTKWLPATMGGTYYPAGIYLYNGSTWVSDRNEIALSLEDVLKNSLRNVTSTDTFLAANETINCTANTFTINLPTAVGIKGVVYTLVNSGSGIITLQGNGVETINGSTSIDIKRQYTSRTVQSDGNNWIIK